MFDSLGPDAIRFIVGQTQMTTMFVSKDYVKKYCDLKIEE